MIDLEKPLRKQTNQSRGLGGKTSACYSRYIVDEYPGKKNREIGKTCC